MFNSFFNLLERSTKCVRKPVVLIIDDGAVATSIMRRVCRRFDYDSIVATIEDIPSAIIDVVMINMESPYVQEAVDAVRRWEADRKRYIQNFVDIFASLAASMNTSPAKLPIVGIKASKGEDNLLDNYNLDSILEIQKLLSSDNLNVISKISQMILPGASKPTNSMKVLIVDDSIVIRKILSKALRDAGYQAHIAESEVAYNVINSGDYDIVLMDLNLPIMDGLEATRLLRKNEFESSEFLNTYVAGAFNISTSKNNERHQIIIGISANMSKEASALEAGMDAFLPKSLVNSLPLMENLFRLNKKS
jgi:CheY-like chemotaxis protein